MSSHCVMNQGESGRNTTVIGMPSIATDRSSRAVAVTGRVQSPSRTANQLVALPA